MPIVPFPALAVAGALLLAAGSAATTPPTAQSPAAQSAAASPAAQTAAPVAGSSGMVVFVDPETGGLTSTPPTPEAAAELLALEAALNRSSEGLVETTASDGSPMIDLQGRFQNVMLAGASAHGPHALCTTSAKTARTVAAPATSPAAPVALGREEM